MRALKGDFPVIMRTFRMQVHYLSEDPSIDDQGQAQSPRQQPQPAPKLNLQYSFGS